MPRYTSIVEEVTMKPIAVVDFETEAIEPQPNYPPKPVGVAIKLPNKPAHYYAFGHPTENNSTRSEALKALRAVWRTHDILCHNAAFDIEVAHVRLGLPIPKRIHDSMLLLYLYDPNARSIALKPSVKSLLNIDPVSQSELRDWVLNNVPEATKKPRNWGAYISKAPGKLVAKYAGDDAEYSWLIFDVLHSMIEGDGMLEAYDTECALIPVVLEMERKGVRIDYNQLDQDTAQWEVERDKLRKSIFRKLGREFNLNSSRQLVDALELSGSVDPDKWLLTDKGNISTSRESLTEAVTNKRLLKQLVRHSILVHMLNNFCIPWLDRMESYERARLYPRFHSTRQDSDRALGTRSGRFSSSDPSFQQFNREPDDPTLPFMRRYLLPEEGHELLARDYDQQELRILAHIVGDELLKMYQDDPRLDLHEVVRELMVGGSELSRSQVKQLNFSVIYGGGVPRVADMLDIEYDEASTLKRAHSVAVPGLKAKMREIQETARSGEPVTTHGGRLYYPVSGKEYVQLNRMIQGSAADHTKRAMLRIAKAFKGYDARMVVQVHDEIIVTADKSCWREIDREFKKAMEFRYFDLDTPTSGKHGRNWGEMKGIRA